MHSSLFKADIVLFPLLPKPRGMAGLFCNIVAIECKEGQLLEYTMLMHEKVCKILLRWPPTLNSLRQHDSILRPFRLLLTVSLVEQV